MYRGQVYRGGLGFKKIKKLISIPGRLRHLRVMSSLSDSLFRKKKDRNDRLQKATCCKGVKDLLPAKRIDDFLKIITTKI